MHGFGAKHPTAAEVTDVGIKAPSPAHTVSCPRRLSSAPSYQPCTFLSHSCLLVTPSTPFPACPGLAQAHRTHCTLGDPLPGPGHMTVGASAHQCASAVRMEYGDGTAHRPTSLGPSRHGECPVPVSRALMFGTFPRCMSQGLVHGRHERN